MKTILGMTSKNKSCDFGCHFSQIKACWMPFFQSKHVGRHFCLYLQKVCPDFRDFAKVFTDFCGFCPDFQEFCLDFHQINTFGGAPAPLPPTPLVGSFSFSKFFDCSYKKCTVQVSQRCWNVKG